MLARQVEYHIQLFGQNILFTLRDEYQQKTKAVIFFSYIDSIDNPGTILRTAFLKSFISRLNRRIMTIIAL